MESSKLSGNKPARQQEQLKHHLHPFMVAELSCPEGQTRLPQAQRGLTSSKCEVKHEAFAAERHTQQVIFGLSEYLQLRVVLWKHGRADVLHRAVNLLRVFIPPETSPRRFWLGTGLAKSGIIYNLKL